MRRNLRVRVAVVVVHGPLKCLNGLQHGVKLKDIKRHETRNDSKRETTQNAKCCKMRSERNTSQKWAPCAVLGQATCTMPSHKLVPWCGGWTNDMLRMGVLHLLCVLQHVVFPLLIKLVLLT